jgi:heme/copper-type cytochrome/quinol oxidase subunit 2
VNISANLNLNNAFNKPHHLGQFLLLPIITAFFVLNNFVAMLLVNIFNVDFNTFYFKNYQFTSNMVKTSDLSNGFYRLLATDNNVILPYGSWIRFLITSLDVIHSWTVPSLGIKLDACPGRLNQTALFLKREGFFYGQCSEICGVNHAFMPIVVEGVDLESFYAWCKAPFSSFNELEA